MAKHDYTKHSKTQEAPVPLEEPISAPPTTESEVEDDKIIGVVTECVKLNVREEPVADAEILTTIPLGAEVQVDIFESTEDYYKITTEAGVEGYCVKDYINID